jgi:Flp pilus assembly protein TadB
MMAVIGVFGSAVLILSLAYLWARERAKREVLELEREQTRQDARLNQEANEAYRRKREFNSNRVDRINPDDPWAGLNKRNPN